MRKRSSAGLRLTAQRWTLCYASKDQCGRGNDKSFSGDGKSTFYPTSKLALYDSRVTRAFTLWAFFVRNGSWYNDDARTGTADCAKKPDTYCVY
jgi:hypothetical protein